MVERTPKTDPVKDATSSGPAVATSPRQPADLASAVFWYRQMVIARRFEEETERAFRRGKIGGYLHVYSGQEAVGAGFLAELREDDIFFTAYRDHAQALFRGASPGTVMAELFGKVTGLARGKGGSMHLFDVGRGFYGGYGIVGGHIPLAVGAAYAVRYQGTDRVCLCFMGDGAMNGGAFHEALNMAGLWGAEGLCPLVVVVENNEYAMGTSVARSSAVTDLASRFAQYAIPAERLDGMDFVAVRQAAARVIAEVRASGRPRAVEAVTYRFSGHGAADVFQPYRTKEEVERVRLRDPIVLLERRLREAGLLDDAKVATIHEEAEQVVQEAVEFAERSDPPPPEALYTDVYADEP
ncbi:MAG: pyruvate dehydrogenase (acetyl-transferring) E1 component subunit alpha [Armatimonadota bacterium]|nr:pyruvate dehydrogenase (acetyl-transferring) E1 component subunit alpha [Armatimonadota bacterium]